MSKTPHLTKTERRQVEAIEAVLRPWGLASEVVPGSPHKVVVITSRTGGHYRLPISCTPRDADAAESGARQKAKRLVREINERMGL